MAVRKLRAVMEGGLVGKTQFEKEINHAFSDELAREKLKNRLVIRVVANVVLR